jgi:SAM-dependent methyltransferase
MEMLSDPVSTRAVEYLSPPAEVSMADSWFEIASIAHFWIERRFRVLQTLAGELIPSAREMAEIGCGHGLLQRQIEDTYNRTVTGLDLNEYALKRNQSKHSRVCCYDILQRHAAFQLKFDVIFLFDVLEHIADEDNFLQALLFHLAPQGKLVISVPAGPWAYSQYDTAAGHIRRYAFGSIRKTAARNQLAIQKWTYWGLPLVPALAARKLWLASRRERDDVIKTGFDSRAPWINRALGAWSRCEVIPQTFLGTSLMAVLTREITGNQHASR